MIFLGIYDEWRLAINTLNRVLTLTNERVMARADGTYDPVIFPFLSNYHRVLFVRGRERLKVRGNGGLACHTWLKLFLQFSQDSYLIKIDPDSVINRAPTVPTGYDVASNYSAVKHHLLGGAIAFSRIAVKLIVDSQLLLDQKYQGRNWCYRWRNQEWIPCEDAILYDVIQRLGLNLVHWDDVYCCHSDQPFNPPKPLHSYSLYHPIQEEL